MKDQVVTERRTYNKNRINVDIEDRIKIDKNEGKKKNGRKSLKIKWSTLFSSLTESGNNMSCGYIGKASSMYLK